jgi:hypothetical protein
MPLFLSFGIETLVSRVGFPRVDAVRGAVVVVDDDHSQNRLCGNGETDDADAATRLRCRIGIDDDAVGVGNGFVTSTGTRPRLAM